MTALKTTSQQREAYLRYKRSLRDLHLPDSEGGACRVILNLTDLVHDADLALTLEDGISKISDTVRELQQENAVLLNMLRDLTAPSSWEQLRQLLDRAREFLELNYGQVQTG